MPIRGRGGATAPHPDVGDVPDAFLDKRDHRPDDLRVARGNYPEAGVGVVAVEAIGAPRLVALLAVAELLGEGLGQRFVDGPLVFWGAEVTQRRRRREVRGREAGVAGPRSTSIWRNSRTLIEADTLVELTASTIVGEAVHRKRDHVVRGAGKVGETASLQQGEQDLLQPAATVFGMHVELALQFCCGRSLEEPGEADELLVSADDQPRVAGQLEAIGPRVRDDVGLAAQILTDVGTLAGLDQRRNGGHVVACRRSQEIPQAREVGLVPMKGSVAYRSRTPTLGIVDASRRRHLGAVPGDEPEPGVEARVGEHVALPLVEPQWGEAEVLGERFFERLVHGRLVAAASELAHLDAVGPDGSGKPLAQVDAHAVEASRLGEAVSREKGELLAVPLLGGDAQEDARAAGCGAMLARPRLDVGQQVSAQHSPVGILGVDVEVAEELDVRSLVPDPGVAGRSVPRGLDEPGVALEAEAWQVPVGEKFVLV